MSIENTTTEEIKDFKEVVIDVEEETIEVKEVIKPVNDSAKYVVVKKESAVIEVIGWTVNTLTHVLIALVLFVCIWFSCLPHIDLSTQLHILFCVLGYQFFMSQGVLVFSKNNSWTRPLNYRQKRWTHWVFQILGIFMAAVGSAIIIKEKRLYNDPHFNTAHGILGLCALLMSFVSLINGAMALHLSKLRKFINGSWLKVSHYIAGIATLMLAGVSLCFGYDKDFFRIWADDKLVIFLVVVTMLFTVLVIADRIVFKLWKPVTSL